MSINKLRDRIRKGEVTPPTGGGSSPVGEGIFKTSITEASAGRGENGNFRGMIKVQVESGGEDETVLGRTFNLYIQTVDEEYAEEQIALWTQILGAYGISDEKIFDDAEDIQDIVTNITTLLTKQIKKKDIFIIIERKEQSRKGPKGMTMYYNNIDLDGTGEVAGVGTETTETTETESEPDKETETKTKTKAETKTKKSTPASKSQSDKKPWE